MIRVAICDDDAVFRAFLRGVLRGAGDLELVSECSDGACCLEALATHRPDVLLLDWSMPVMGGEDVLRGLAGASAGTRVVVLSGEADREVAATAVQLGAVEFVPKSGAGLVDLIPQRVRAALEGPRPRPGA